MMRSTVSRRVATPAGPRQSWESTLMRPLSCGAMPPSVGSILALAEAGESRRWWRPWQVPWRRIDADAGSRGAVCGVPPPVLRRQPVSPSGLVAATGCRRWSRRRLAPSHRGRPGDAQTKPPSLPCRWHRHPDGSRRRGRPPRLLHASQPFDSKMGRRVRPRASTPRGRPAR